MRFISKRSLLSLLVAAVAVYLFYIYKSGLFQSFPCSLFGVSCPPIAIEGSVAPRFEMVKQLFEQNYKDGEEISSCVVAFHKSEKIVDLCGGFADSGAPYRNALQSIFSATKVVSAVVVGMLVDRGLLEYEEKVTTYWPEFGQGGKENVTVTDLLTHSAGLVWLDEPLDFKDYADLDLVAKRYAEQQHNFGGEKKQAYHRVTYGFMLNELVRRRDPKHRTIGQFVREEMNEKLGTEIFIGLTKEERSEVGGRFTRMHDASVARWLARLILRGDTELFKQKTMDFALLEKARTAIRLPDDSIRNTLDYFMVEIPATNGLSNAESLAKLAAAMAQHGEFNGVKLMSAATASKSLELLPMEEDFIFKMNFTRTKGGFTQFNWNKKYPSYGWIGQGGILIVWDPVAEIGFGYVMNGSTPGFSGRGYDLIALIQDIVYSQM